MDTTIKQPSISFGYSSILKTLYRKGKLPSVKYDFYGDRLSPKNCTLDHLIPHSKGGKTTLDNLVLADRENNRLRGNKSIIPFFDVRNVTQYLCQFADVKRPGFNGNEYIASVLKTLLKIFNKAES